MRTAFLILMVVITFGHPRSSISAPGDEHWDPQFGWPGTSNWVYAITADAGRIFVGGINSQNGPLDVGFVETWDGETWKTRPGLDGGSIAAVYDSVMFQNELYVGGTFGLADGVSSPGLAKWDGSHWVPVGGFRGVVLALAASAEALYAGGLFSTAGSTPVANVARWDGRTWTSLGDGLGTPSDFNSKINVLHLHQGTLFAGGGFVTSGGTTVRRIARWTGTTWEELGGGADAPVNAMASQGAALFVGGGFINVGSMPAARIARWEDEVWSPLDTGVNASVSAIGATSTQLLVGGAFTNAGGVSVRRFAVWDGAKWVSTGSGMNDDVNRIRVSGETAYVGGKFTQADDVLLNHIGLWHNGKWSALGTAGRVNGVAGVISSVRAIASRGTEVFVGGVFTAAGPISANRIARFDGYAWHALGEGITGRSINPTAIAVNAIALSGQNVFAAGVFDGAGDISLRNIARWDGNQWHALGSGIPGKVSALATKGNDLFAGGDFTLSTEDGTAFNVARWDGTRWHSLPGNFLGTISNFFVNALAVQGSELIIGGSFFSASTNVVRHDGSKFIPMETGVNGTVNALVVAGSDLYAGGRFTTAGSLAANRLAKWDGKHWSPLDTELGGSTSISVTALAWDGSKLYAGGTFTKGGEVTINRLGSWDGSSWRALGSGVSRSLGSVNMAALGVNEYGDLFVGGGTEYAGGKPSFLFARWNAQTNFDVIPKLEFTRLERLPGGIIQLELSSIGVHAYRIDYSTDFKVWQPRATNSTPTFLYSDPASKEMSKIFYRAVELP